MFKQAKIKIVNAISVATTKHPKLVAFGIIVGVSLVMVAIFGLSDLQHVYAIPDRVNGGPLLHLTLNGDQFNNMNK